MVLNLEFGQIDSEKENIGLTHFKGNIPTKAETEIAKEKALKKAHEEYDKYMKTHLTQAEKDYLEIMGEDIRKLKG